MDYNFKIMQGHDITSLSIMNKVDAVCITTNGVVKSNGQLVMGAGCAKQFATKFPNTPKALGSKVRTHGNHVFLAGIHEHNGHICSILSFPTKHDYRDKSDLELIKQSAMRLVKWADKSGATDILIPSPGTGLGGLIKSDVYNALNDILDERFTIVTK